MAQIADLLHRRTDLSTFIVHLTRDGHGSTGRENLIEIMRDSVIEARSVYGMGKTYAQTHSAFASTQKVTCFSETPLEHVWMMCEDIAGRQQIFQPYGLAFTKVWARRSSVNPVWYLDITPGHDWLTQPLNALLAEAVAEADNGGQPLEESHIAGITPFVEQMGPTNQGTQKEFWWEREWRKQGNLTFATWRKVVCVFAPQDDHDDLHDDLEAVKAHAHAKVPPILDPTWGLERMISAMRGIDELEAGPLPPI